MAFQLWKRFAAMFVTVLFLGTTLSSLAGSEWQTLEPIPSATLDFPPGGGTCTTYLRLNADGTVKDVRLNVTGLPTYTQGEVSADANALWSGAESKTNLTADQNGIGLGKFGSWWEEPLNKTGNYTRQSPSLNVSIESRVMVLGDFPVGTNYTVDILDPTAGNVVLQKGLKNGDELDAAIWAGRETAYRTMKMNLTVNGTRPNATPLVVKWGIGTGWRMDSSSSFYNISRDIGEMRLDVDLNSTNYRHLMPRRLDGWLPSHIIVNSRGNFIQGICVNGQVPAIQIYDRWGVPISKPIEVSANRGWGMALAAGPNGTFIVAATEESLLDGRHDVYAQWFDGDGIKIGNKIYICTALKDQLSPAIACGSNGDFVVAWDDFRRIDGTDIYAQKFFSNGTRDGTEILVGACDYGWTGNQANVAINSKNEFAVVWWRWTPTSFDCMLRIYSPNGTPNCPEVLLSSGMSVDVAEGPDNDFLVTSCYRSVVAQRFSSNGESNGSALNVNITSPYPHDSYIAKKPTGGYFVIWMSEKNSPMEQFGRSLDSKGVPIGEEIFIGAVYGRQSSRPAVEPDGNVMVSWAESDCSYTQILSPPYYTVGYAESPPIQPFDSTYGNLIANVTLTAGTDYWVNVTDPNNNALLPYLKNGHPITLDTIKNPEILLNLTLRTEDYDTTPIVYELGIGLSLLPDYDTSEMIGNTNLSISENRIRLNTYLDNSRWTSYSESPVVLTNGSPGEFDCDHFWTSFVMHDGISFKMWYGGISSTPESSGLGYASSEDGLSWIKSPYNPILQGENKTKGLESPFIIKDDGLYKMWYLDNNHQGYSYASSVNGITWSDFTYSVIWNDVDWESYAIYHCSIIKEDNIYKMWYMSYTAMLGYATSTDGISWTKYQGNPILNGTIGDWDEYGIAYSYVIKDDDEYLLYYCSGNGTIPYSIGLAFSKDGINWTKYENNPIIRTPAGASVAYWPCVVRRQETYYLWFVTSGLTNIRCAMNTRIYSPKGNIESNKYICANDIVDITPSWNSKIPTKTSLQVRLCVSPDNASWSNWVNVSSGKSYGPADFTKWGPYVQYNISMNTSDPKATPVLSDFRLDYCPLLSSGEILGPEIHAPEGTIVSARPVLNASIPTGTSVEIWFSDDNGTTWGQVPNGIESTSTIPGTMLRWKLVLNGDANDTPLVNGIDIYYRTRHLPSGISIDIGDDGTIEWWNNASLEGAAPATSLGASLDAYIASHKAEADAEGYVSIPVKISSVTGGKIKLGDVSADWARFPKVLDFGPQGVDLALDTAISITFSEPMNAASAVSSIEIRPAVSVMGSWSSDGRNLTLSHTGLLEETTYNVTVRTGALSKDGAPMPVELSWEFKAVLLPSAFSFSPSGSGTGYVNLQMKLGFNKAMNRTSVETSLAIQPSVVLRHFEWTNDTELRFMAPLLEAGTAYNLTVGLGAQDLLGFHIPAAQTFPFRTMATQAGPADAPKVIGHGPTGNVATAKPTIWLAFDRPMDVATVWNAISFDPPVNLTAVPKFSNGADFYMGIELQPGTEYFVTLNSSARSQAGRYLPADFAWGFMTQGAEVKDTTLPMVAFTDPKGGATDVTGRRVVTIAFNERMDMNKILPAASLIPTVAGNWSWLDGKGVFLQFTPASALPDAKYTVTLNATLAKDESGNSLDGNGNGLFDGKTDDYTFSFVTGRPHLLQRFPGINEKKVGAGTTIRLEFDRPVNLTSLKAAFSITPDISGDWSLDQYGKVATFTPQSGFKKGTTYTVTVLGSLADADGVTLGTDVQWSFATIKAPVPLPEAGFPWWLIALLLVILAVGAGAYAYSRRTKAPAPEAPEPEREAEPGIEAEDEPVKEPKKEVTETPEPKAEEGMEVKSRDAVKEIADRASAETVAPAVLASPPVQTTLAAPTPTAAATHSAVAPDGFAVEDIFLMYRDGRLIHHTTRSLKADMDVDIMTSMLKAVQDFVKESIGMADGVDLGSMEYGGNKIFFEKGKYTILAAVIIGEEPAGFRDEMKGAVRNIESEFGTVLPTWDGTVQKLAGTKRFLGQLGTYKPAEETAGEKLKADVSLKAELEFYQGFVRLKVAVKNNMRTMIASAAFKLMFDEAAMKLYSIEPELERRGDEIVLGIVGPREKKAIAFYLDPQICTESYVEGILSYKDAEGNLEMIKMPKKLTSVVCPILFTEENINTAMLKRMAMEELDKKDTKVFAVPAMIGPQRAFEIGKAAIQHHDLRLVRELKNEKPYEAEAWYYGKAKGREEKVIVRARVIADRNFLEFFVASNSTLMLTGMLAELKSDLNKEIETRKVRMGMKQVTDQKEVDAMTTIRTLLEKATDAEIDAGDTEAR